MYICNAPCYRFKKGKDMTIVTIPTRRGTARIRTTLRPSVISFVIRGV